MASASACLQQSILSAMVVYFKNQSIKAYVSSLEFVCLISIRGLQLHSALSCLNMQHKPMGKNQKKK